MLLCALSKVMTRNYRQDNLLNSGRVTEDNIPKGHCLAKIHMELNRYHKHLKNTSYMEREGSHLTRQQNDKVMK